MGARSYWERVSSPSSQKPSSDSAAASGVAGMLPWLPLRLVGRAMVLLVRA